MLIDVDSEFFWFSVNLWYSKEQAIQRNVCQEGNWGGRG